MEIYFYKGEQIQKAKFILQLDDRMIARRGLHRFFVNNSDVISLKDPDNLQPGHQVVFGLNGLKKGVVRRINKNFITIMLDNENVTVLRKKIIGVL